MLEENKMIAEFLGCELYNWGKVSEIEQYCFRGGCVEEIRKRANLPKANSISADMLDFDKNWNQLMPVVENLEKLGYGFHVSPNSIEVIDYTTGNEETIVSFDFDFDCKKIEQFHYTVVELIKWHNKKIKLEILKDKKYD